MFRQEYAHFSVFAGLDSTQISQLSPFIVECPFPKDTVIFAQGQPADHLYILLAGEVLVRYKPYDGPPLTVARILSGGVFGWSAAMRREVYTSAAITLQDCLSFRIRHTDLQTLYTQYPETGKIFLERLAGVIAERLRSTHPQVLELLTEGFDVNGKPPKRSVRK